MLWIRIRPSTNLDTLNVPQVILLEVQQTSFSMERLAGGSVSLVIRSEQLVIVIESEQLV